MYYPDVYGNGSFDFDRLNITDDFFPASLRSIHYHKYVFFALCSALVGLPSNILLLVIIVRIGLFRRRQSGLTYLTEKPIGSFERFLFEIVFIDTLLIIYHFLDNFLSYIHEDRSSGQHYLIHVSDFCCKFFTYIAKMSVLLTTWLLLFLIFNQLILTMEDNNNNNNDHSSCWNRGLYYVNAKYSTVFLVFFFSVYNIYPIEVLKYQKKEDLQDYVLEDGGAPGVCSFKSEGKSTQLLNITNYGYSLLGVAIPCVSILIISMIIMYRTCRNKYTNKEGASYHYIAATIGIMHSLFNLPGRCSDLLLMFLPSYVAFSPHLIIFNHEAQSFISLSYSYKCFICILISRRFRLHAKNILCFLIESKYEDRHIPEIINSTNDWHQIPKRKKHKKHYHHHHHHGNKPFLQKKIVGTPTSNKFLSSYIKKDDLLRYTTSESISWIRPYFTQNEKRRLLRPCGRSSSCHDICPTLSSDIIQIPKKYSPNELDTSSSHIATDSSSYIISVTLPNGEYIHLPLPQKHASRHRTYSTSSSLIKNRIDPSSPKDSMNTKLFIEDSEKQRGNTIDCLSSSHIY